MNLNIYNPFKNDILSKELIEKSINFLLNYDPPTEINSEGNKYWFQNGQLHRENDLPAIIRKGGNKYWFQNGQLHRENDLPAVIYKNGNKYWYQNGECHRMNGPAVIFSDGNKFWYLNGKKYSEEDYNSVLTSKKIKK